jgi:hypothetical protein
MKTSPRVVLAILVVMITPARAWNSFGHMEVAAVAWSQLTPQAQKEATRLLTINPQYKTWVTGVAPNQRDQIAFVKAATWPDEIKTLTNYHNDGGRNGDIAPKTPEASQNIGYKDLFRHKYWHFIDEPFSTDGTSLQQPVPPNAQTQIATFRKTLPDRTVSDSIRSYDLAWLLHLVGDVHQPLHATSRFTHSEPGGDAGGNLVKISCTACGSASELHAFWDGLLGENSAPPQSAITAAAALPPADATRAALMDESEWIGESFKIAKASVYVSPIGDTDGPFTLTDNYKKNSLDIAKQQIALAGTRLAKLLNDAFK